MDDLSLAVRAVLNLKTIDAGPETYSAIINLLKTCSRKQNTYPVFDEKTKSRVQSAVATTFYRREKQWAHSILASDDPRARLKEYPFAQFLQKSATRDIKVLKSLVNLPPKPRMLVVGSGCLNITALFYEETIGAIVDNVDISEEAIYLSKRVGIAVQKAQDSIYILGDGANVKFPHVPGQHYDIIHISGLAGSNFEEKQKIITNVVPKLKDDGILVFKLFPEPGGSYVVPKIDVDQFKGVVQVSSSFVKDNINTAIVYFRKNIINSNV